MVKNKKDWHFCFWRQLGGCCLHASSNDGGALGIPEQLREAGFHPGLACGGPCQVVAFCGGWPAPCGYPD